MEILAFVVVSTLIGLAGMLAYVLVVKRRDGKRLRAELKAMSDVLKAGNETRAPRLVGRAEIPPWPMPSAPPPNHVRGRYVAPTTNWPRRETRTETDFVTPLIIGGVIGAALASSDSHASETPRDAYHSGGGESGGGGSSGSYDDSSSSDYGSSSSDSGSSSSSSGD